MLTADGGGRDRLIAVTDHGGGSGASAPGLPGADEAQGAGPADRLGPAVDAEPVVQACRSLFGRGPGDAELAGDNGEGQCCGEVPQDLGLGYGDRRRPDSCPGFAGRFGGYLVGGGNGDE